MQAYNVRLRTHGFLNKSAIPIKLTSGVPLRKGHRIDHFFFPQRILASVNYLHMLRLVTLVQFNYDSATFQQMLLPYIIAYLSGTFFITFPQRWVGRSQRRPHSLHVILQICGFKQGFMRNTMLRCALNRSETCNTEYREYEKQQTPRKI